MAFEQTAVYYKVAGDVIVSPSSDRPQSYGDSSQPPLCSQETDGSCWYQLWIDARGEQPGDYYSPITGTVTVNAQEERCERVDTWEEWTPEQKREAIKTSSHAQIRQPSNLEIAEDATREWVPSQDIGRYKVLVEALAQTDDADLDAFDADLFAYAQTDQDYAANILRQETKNLAWDSELRSAGNGGIFSDTERADVQSRVTANAKVARGLETGVRTPTTGAPREWVTMDGEDVEDASFYQVEYDWNGPRYIPLVTLQAIPDGINTAQVFAMVYDKDNVYRGWMPFAQNPDGTWQTPSNVSYDGIAQAESVTWRVAIAYLGTDAEHEITSRVVVVPPNSAWSRVRWGGRNGAPAQRRRTIQ